MNQKGFSLVELMIVVVIMGILIAVAVPLYGLITDRARANTCRMNQNMLRSMFAKYILMDERYSSNTLFLTSTKSFDGSRQNAEDVFDPIFLSCFDGDNLPTCPEEDHHYIIQRVTDSEISIQCVKNNTVDEDHQEKP
ncbi:MAG: type II secretion system GspH family protein [Oscillospiraceae bacterium]|nr:type II secretion system GspH family protein [Oscillospiraceae bacterium]